MYIYIYIVQLTFNQDFIFRFVYSQPVSSPSGKETQVRLLPFNWLSSYQRKMNDLPPSLIAFIEYVLSNYAPKKIEKRVFV